MQASPEPPPNADNPLQLLLFVDKRPSAREQIRQIRDSLQNLRAEYDFELQVIDVGEQPYMAEHFRLIATPALVKIHPEPRQSLAGTNLISQLKHFWPYWQRSVSDYLSHLHDEQAQQPVETIANQEIGPAERSDLSPEATGDDADALQATPAYSASPSPVMPLPPDVVRSGIHSVAQSAEVIRLTDEVFRLKQEKEELEHQLQFKDQILSMLAHDLRNPLTAASIALETLEMGYAREEKGQAALSPALTAQLLKHARTQTRTIDRMITDILQAARGASSKLRLQPHQLNLGELCLDVLQSLKELFETKSQQVETDIPSDLPLVYADAERMRQVLTNLLDNAVKYTPVHGRIQVSILHRTTQKVQVSICDNGPGIPEENQERIFEDRFRLKRDESKDGYGIGLSLCQRIIRSHYGQIWVDSKPGKGSCFHFTIPVFRA